MALQRWFERAAQQSESNGGSVIAGAPKVLGPYGLARRMAVKPPKTWRPEEVDCWRSGRVAMRDGRDIVRAAFIADQGVLVLSLPLTAAEADYPGIEQWFPSAKSHAARRGGSVRIALVPIRIRARGYVMRLGRRAFIR